MLKHQTITFIEKKNFVHHFRLLTPLLRHFRRWYYEKEQNRVYSINLTTTKCGLNENNINCTKLKFAIKDCSSKCDQIRSFRSVQWHINGRDKL